MTHRPSSPHFHRRGFTLIELLVVIGIIALLASMALVAYGRVGESARVAGTKTLIKQLDSTLQERMESFRRYDFAPLAQSFFRYSGTGQQYQPVAFFKRLAYRAEFPQRFEDLYGFDGISGDGDSIPGVPLPMGANTSDPNYSRDNSPLWTIIKSRSTATSADLAVNSGSPGDPFISNSELLYLFLTEASSYGLAPLDLSLISPQYIVDEDQDSFPEFRDGWNQPLRFYNAPTGLLRPSGNLYDKDAGPGEVITVAQHKLARNLIRSLPSLPLDTSVMPPVERGLAADEFDHPLNMDPFDYLGITTIDNLTDTGNERLFIAKYHAMDTFFAPLLVSAGPDQLFGLEAPAFNEGKPAPAVFAADNNRNRLGVITNADDIYDNLTNYQRGGF